MAVKGQQTTDAQSNQIPPALRRFVQSASVDGFVEIMRYGDENETHARGWWIKASGLWTQHIPDGFKVTKVTSFGTDIMVAVREE